MEVPDIPGGSFLNDGEEEKKFSSLYFFLDYAIARDIDGGFRRLLDLSKALEWE